MSCQQSQWIVVVEADSVLDLGLDVHQQSRIVFVGNVVDYFVQVVSLSLQLDIDFLGSVRYVDSHEILGDYDSSAHDHKNPHSRCPRLIQGICAGKRYQTSVHEHRGERDYLQNDVPSPDVFTGARLRSSAQLTKLPRIDPQL